MMSTSNAYAFASHDSISTLSAVAVAAEAGWLAGRVATGCERARLRRVAEHDHLTGPLNRTGWQSRARDAVNRAAQAGRPDAVGMIDIDGLMAVNDLLGHRPGDALLRTVAGRLLTHIRLPRVVIRLGGDEFTFVMEGPSPHRIGG